MSLPESFAVSGLRLAMPLIDAFSSPHGFQMFLRDMGWEIDLSAVDDALLDHIPGASDIAERLPIALEAAGELATSQEPGVQIGTMLVELAHIAPAIAQLATFDPADAAAGSPFAAPTFWSGLATDVPHFLVVNYLELYLPPVHRLARLLGVVVDEPREDLPAPFDQQSGTRERLDLAALETLVHDPLEHLRSWYGWFPGGPIDAARIFAELGELATWLGLRSRLAPVAEEFRHGGQSAILPDAHADLGDLRQLDLRLARTSGAAGVAELGIVAVPGASGNAPDSPIDGILVTPSLFGQLDARIPLDRPDGDGRHAWHLVFDASANATGAIGLWASPNGFEPHVGSATGSFGVGIEGRFDPPKPIIGGTTGTRLILRGVDVEFGLAVGTETEITARAALSHESEHPAELIIEAGEGDGFVSTLLGDLSLSVPLAVGISWSSVDGFSMEGSAGIEVRIPLGLSLGTAGARIELNELLLGGVISAATDEPVSATFVAAVTATGVLGPLNVSVKEIGIELDLAPGDGGAIQPALGFKPPRGLGIGIDLSPITGGGYLDIDRAAGSYKGLVHADIISIGITAIVIVETELEDVDGWSMFFALFIEIPQIQLGFGFSLNGVGGLAGINRTIDAEALGSAVRSGALGSILFPEDPIVEAPTIIRELESIFPPANDSYVFGPVVKIGWGTPPIIEAELGIVIAFSSDGVIIAVLGSVTAILPRPEFELIALRLDLAGVIDTGRGTISLDASLHDSHIVGFALAGDMALRANFSDSRSFLFSVGGFHPAFTPPAGFPELARMSLGLNVGSVLEVSFQCYFAITSNTVQFGASFHFWAKAMGFEASGGASFDALIQFNPFQLNTEVSFHVSVTAVGVSLLDVLLHASITGPEPWVIIGTARFEVLGCGKDFRVHKVIGLPRTQPTTAAAELFEAYTDELARDENWEIVAGTPSGVTFVDRTPGDDDAVLLARPDSLISVAQTLVPLGQPLDKFGNAPVGGDNHFGLTVDGSLGSSGPATEWFAPAHFFDVGPKKKLSRPSFEEYEAGVRFGSDEVINGPMVDLPVGHAEFIIDPERDVDGEARPTKLSSPPTVDLTATRTLATAGAPTAFEFVGGSAVTTEGT